MKHIVKQNEPRELRELREQANEDWQPIYDDLGGVCKKAVHASLLTEQGHICCYCNMRILQDDSHIEHFRPRSRFPEVELEYENLLASCQLKAKRREPLRCGKRKAAWFDDALMISPLQKDCESRFRFTADGAIYPADDDDPAAKETIERLGLDNYELRDRRLKRIDAVLVDIDKLKPDEIRKLIQEFERPDENGFFAPFCTALVYSLASNLGYESPDQ